MQYIISLPQSRLLELQTFLTSIGEQQDPVPGVRTFYGLWSNMDNVQTWYEMLPQEGYTLPMRWSDLSEDGKMYIGNLLADFVGWHFPDYVPMELEHDEIVQLLAEARRLS